MNDRRSGNGLMAFVAGIAVGTAIGILFAPKSGEETREYLIGGAMDAIDTVASRGQSMAENARDAVTDTTEQVRQTVNDRTEQIRRAVNDKADQVRQAVNETADQVRQVVSDTAAQVAQVTGAVHDSEHAHTKARGA